MRERRLFADLLSFFQAIPAFLSSDKTRAGSSTYHRVIIAASAVLGSLGIAIGLVAFGMVLFDETASNEMYSARNGLVAMLVLPLMLGAIGIFLGVALTCTFAPTSFLTGPTGAKWMRLIGTQSVFAARIICAVVATVLIVVPAFVAITIK